LRRFAILLLAVLTLLGLPGAGEALENVAHGVMEGHSAHAQYVDSGEGAHDPMHVEHGCGGGTHVCPCHAPTFAASASPSLEIDAPSDVTLLALSTPEQRAPRGVIRAPFRPPTS
jgi:hypothetical protein